MEKMRGRFGEKLTIFKDNNCSATVTPTHPPVALNLLSAIAMLLRVSLIIHLKVIGSEPQREGPLSAAI